MTWATNAHAIDDDKYAHAGVSYALNMGLYGVMHKAIGMPTMPSMIFSTAISLFAGLCKEGMIDSKMDMDDMKANAVGIGLSNLTILTFDF